VLSLKDPETEIERKDEERDVDQRTGELPRESSQEGVGRAFGQRIRADRRETSAASALDSPRGEISDSL
jgi:hypothetical protein